MAKNQGYVERLPLEPGQVGEYGKLRTQYHGKVDGLNLERDHQPSKGAAKRVEVDGKALKGTEYEDILTDKMLTVAIPCTVHGASPTTGMRNKDILHKDAENLEAAAFRDGVHMLANAKKLDPKNLAKYEEGFKKMTSLTNEDFDDLLHAIISDDEEYSHEAIVEKRVEEGLLEQTVQDIIAGKLKKLDELPDYLEFSEESKQKLFDEELSEKELYSILEEAAIEPPANNQEHCAKYKNSGKKKKGKKKKKKSQKEQ